MNKLYEEIVPTRQSIQKCLKQLCQSEPYRMLSEWSYDVNCNPLSDSEEEQDLTDVSYIPTKKNLEIHHPLIGLYSYFSAILWFLIDRYRDQFAN